MKIEKSTTILVIMTTNIMNEQTWRLYKVSYMKFVHKPKTILLYLFIILKINNK